MNILFRKNFHVESSGERGFGGMGGSKPSKGVLNKGRRSRECGGYSHMEEHHFRTHIFLSPPGVGCGSFSDCDSGSQRRPSVTLMKWAVGGGTRRKPSGRPEASLAPETPTPTASRQVSFSKGANPIPAPPPTVTKEPITLATLNRDCFIIPVASLDRFLPAGVPLYLKVVCWVEKELLATKTNQRCETYLIFEGRLTT
uniref:Uncharacterized protein n=1 Tax=Timema cristinae TaxID=61476 RepID=A0A7R9GSF5_TIMCR|nr:unnamed protein product [Timema cristinae]